MSTLISDKTENTTATSRLALRVIQSGVEKKTINLKKGKCTIGSSASCRIQLVGSGVRPLHCLVVQNEKETVATRWAPGVLLNGRDFATATIQQGDCLQIGDVQLHLITEQEAGKPKASSSAEVAPEVPSQFPQNESTQQVAKQEKTQETPASYEPSQLSADRLVTKLWTANYQARRRCRGLVLSLRELRAEAGSTDQQIFSLQEELRGALEERARITSELEQIRTNAAERELQIAGEMDSLIEALNAADSQSSDTATISVEHAAEREQLGGQISQLTAEREQLQGEREQLADTCKQYEQQQQGWQQSLEERDQRIGELLREMQQAHSEILAAEERGAEQNAGYQNLQNELNELISERDQLVAVRSEYENRQQEWEQTLAEKDRQLEELQSEFASLCESTQQFDEQIVGLNHRAEESQHRLIELQTERDEFSASQANFSERYHELEQVLAERDQSIEQLREELAHGQTLVQQTEQQIAEQVARTDKAQQELSQLQAECAELRAAQNTSEDRQRELEETLAERERAIQDMQTEQRRLCEVLHSFEEGSFAQVDAGKRLEEELANACTKRDELEAGQLERDQRMAELQNSLEERDHKIAELAEQLTTAGQARVELEAEITRRNDAYQTLETEVDALRNQCETLSSENSASNSRENDLQQTATDYQQRLETLETELQEIRQQRQSLEEALAERAEAFSQHEMVQQELQDRNEKLEQENRAELERRQNLDQEVAERTQRVELLEVDLQSVHAELGRTVEQVSKLETERTAAEELLAEAQQMLTEKASLEETPAPGVETEAEATVSEAEETHSESPVDEAIDRLRNLAASPEPESEPETPKEEFKPTSFIDQYSNMLDENGEEDFEPVEPTPAAPVAPVESSLNEESDEVALEDYMAKMMQRMCGESQPEDRSKLPSSPPADSPAVVEAVPQPQRPEEIAEVLKPLGLEELGQTSQKPELPTSLAAMRELANSSARHAIAKHHKRRYLENTIGQIAICITLLVVATYLLLSAEGNQNSFIAGCTAAAVGGAWGLWLTVGAIRSGSPTEKAPAELPVDDSPLPIETSP
ncbi:MAG: hypothetical protein GXP26_05845 [Planctomycetes bacterium]|nr:hypothetical protein [Planctomycetota bacterium]